MYHKLSRQTEYKTLGASFFTVLITLIVYLPALQNGFVNFDDIHYVSQNISSIDIRFLKWIFSPEANPTWHPLTLFTFALDYQIWGFNPSGYHLTNLIFHTLNTALVFTLVVRLIGCGSLAKNELREKSLVAGIVTALLFGIHPLHVESVAWIAERKDALCGFFYLSSLLAYLKYTSSVDLKRPVYYSVSFILFILALMSKPMAVSLPVVLLIFDLYPLRRLSNLKAVLSEKLLFFVFGLLSTLITIWVHYSQGVLKTWEMYSPMLRIYAALRAFIFYIIKIILPFNLAPYYPYPKEIDFLNFAVYAALIIAITLFCVQSFKKKGVFLTIWFYYIVTLAPVIGVVKVGSFAAADRYTYLPSLGPFLLMGLAVGTALEISSKTYRTTIIAILILISCFLVNRTVRQIGIWHDSVTLWSYEIKLFPEEASLPYINRGDAYNSLRNYPLAMDDYDKAVKIDPKNPEAYVGRGVAYYNLNNYAPAIADYNKAIELYPMFGEAYMNRGNAYDRIGNIRQAIKDYKMAAQLLPQNPDVYYNLGIVYSKIGEKKLAYLSYLKAASLGSRQAAYMLNTVKK